MKQLLALVLAVGLVGCVEESQQVSTPGGNYPYARYSTTSEVSGPSGVYASWTTAALQKKRLDMYAMLPQTQTANGVPAYISHGPQLPAQDEIKKIEAELNKRYKAGDKSAQLKEWWPRTRRHIT
ncbi:MAG: hypothetical protein ABI925_07550 [Verrucomicrobiota bacterium]